jgi:hypothetical protein
MRDWNIPADFDRLIQEAGHKYVYFCTTLSGQKLFYASRSLAEVKEWAELNVFEPYMVWNQYKEIFELVKYYQAREKRAEFLNDILR